MCSLTTITLITSQSLAKEKNITPPHPFLVCLFLKHTVYGRKKLSTGFHVAQSSFVAQVQEMRAEVGIDSCTINLYMRLEIVCLADTYS